MKKLLLLLCLLAGAFSGNAQTIDSVARLDTSTSPGHIYVRLKFPHQGFIYSRTNIFYTPLGVPTVLIDFYFKECTATGGPYSYEDTLDVNFVPGIIRNNFYFSLYLDSNNILPDCILRNTPVLVDTSFRYYWPKQMSVTRAVEMDLLLYPNPVTSSQIHLDLKGALQRPEKIQLYSLEGRRLETTYNSANSLIQLPETLSSGTYFLLLRFPDGRIIRKKITVQ